MTAPDDAARLRQLPAAPFLVETFQANFEDLQVRCFAVTASVQFKTSRASEKSQSPFSSDMPVRTKEETSP